MYRFGKDHFINQLLQQVYRFNDSDIYREVDDLYKKMCPDGIETHLKGKDVLGQKISNYGTMIVMDKFGNNTHATGHKILVDPGVFNISAIFQPTVEFMTQMDKLVYQR
jgi:hypothetical protein